MEFDSFIPGIGNEVIIGCVCVAIGCFPLMLYLYKYFRHHTDGIEVHNHDALVGDSAPAIPTIYNRDICPICLGEHTLPVESNCGHLFCGLCLQQYYRVRQVEMLSCPLCRTTVTVLFICFTDAEVENQQLSPNRDRVYNFVNEYNQCCSRFRLSFRQILTDWPTTMRHLFRELTSVNGLMRLTRARISLCFIAAVLYLLSPLDIIPEALFGLLGFFDDVVMIILLGLYVSVMYRRLIVMHGSAGSPL